MALVVVTAAEVAEMAAEMVAVEASTVVFVGASIELGME